MRDQLTSCTDHSLLDSFETVHLSITNEQLAALIVRLQVIYQ